MTSYFEACLAFESCAFNLACALYLVPCTLCLVPLILLVPCALYLVPYLWAQSNNLYEILQPGN